jgi:hypothetical protein
MDMLDVLSFLRAEAARLDQAILAVEALAQKQAVAPKSRRGRKFMSGEERAEVSRRMREYWMRRRTLPMRVHSAGA